MCLGRNAFHESNQWEMSSNLIKKKSKWRSSHFRWDIRYSFSIWPKFFAALHSKHHIFQAINREIWIFGIRKRSLCNDGKNKWGPDSIDSADVNHKMSKSDGYTVTQSSVHGLHGVRTDTVSQWIRRLSIIISALRISRIDACAPKTRKR